jgi:hypothetical protein
MKNTFIFLFLLIVGLSQLTGDLLNWPFIKAIAAATGSSPAPKVFTAHKGFETYSAKFFIEWTDINNIHQSLQITPKLYGQIHGPYNRRNAYGAVISYGPVLEANPKTKPMFASVARYALSNKSSILSELGINTQAISGSIKIRIEPRQKLPENHMWTLEFEAINYE